MQDQNNVLLYFNKIWPSTRYEPDGSYKKDDSYKNMILLKKNPYKTKCELYPKPCKWNNESLEAPTSDPEKSEKSEKFCSKPLLLLLVNYGH